MVVPVVHTLIPGKLQTSQWFSMGRASVEFWRSVCSHLLMLHWIKSRYLDYWDKEKGELLLQVRGCSTAVFHFKCIKCS